MKKLYRSNENKIILGVFGGIGDYLGIDPTVLRVVYIFVSVFSLFFPAIIAYVVAYFIIPVKSA